MRTTRAIFFLVHHEPKKHSSCPKNRLKCCIPKKNGTEKENRTSIRMTVRVERWGGIIDDDRDRYVTCVPAIPHSRAWAACCRLFPLRSSDWIFAESFDRQNSWSSSSSSIVLVWRAVTSERPTGREGRHTFLLSSDSPLQYRSQHSTIRRPAVCSSVLWYCVLWYFLFLLAAIWRSL